MSEQVVSSTGVPICRSVCMTAVVGCASGGQETEYRELVEHFVAQCGNNHLLLNVAKTKEMVVDFRRTRTKLNTISILGEEMEVVKQYRYLTTDWARM